MAQAQTESTGALLSPREAAKYLGVSRSSLYELLNRSALPSVKVLRCRRIRRDDLDRIVAQGAC